MLFSGRLGGEGSLVQNGGDGSVSRPVWSFECRQWRSLLVSVQGLVGQRRGGAGRHLMSDLGESAAVAKGSFHGWGANWREGVLSRDDSFFSGEDTTAGPTVAGREPGCTGVKDGTGLDWTKRQSRSNSQQVWEH